METTSTVSFFSIFSRAFRLYFRKFPFLFALMIPSILGIHILIIYIIWTLRIIGKILSYTFSTNPNGLSPSPIPDVPSPSVILFIGLAAFSFFAFLALLSKASISHAVMAFEKNEPISFTTCLKKCFNNFFASYLLSFLYYFIYLLIVISAAALFLQTFQPNIGLLYLGVFLFLTMQQLTLTFPVFIHESVSIWQAFRLSLKCAFKNFKKVFAISVICFLLYIPCGLILFGILYFITTDLSPYQASLLITHPVVMSGYLIFGSLPVLWGIVTETLLYRDYKTDGYFNIT